MNILVVLASFNGEKYIREQIISILNQKYINVTIKVFDDYSSDKTIEVVNNIKALDSRVDVIENNIQSGSAAKNFLISLCSLKRLELSHYDFIALSDQDDIWLPEKLHRALNEIKNQNLDLYMSNLIMWEEESSQKSLIKKSYKQKRFDFLFEGGSAGCTYVFSIKFYTNFIEKVIPIDLNEWKYLSHDWLIYFFARLNHAKVLIDDVAYIYYRIHKNNVHGQLNKNTFFSYLKRFNMILSQWYYIQSYNFSQLLNENSEEYYIYKMYNKNWFTRSLIIFKYNFRLMRSRTKFIQFALVSLIPRFKRAVL